MIADLSIKLAKKKKVFRDKITRYWKPDPKEEPERYEKSDEEIIARAGEGT